MRASPKGELIDRGKRKLKTTDQAAKRNESFSCQIGGML